MRRLLAVLIFVATVAAPLHADLKYVVRTTAHASTVPVPPSANPMFAMLGGVVVSTIVPNGGVQMTAIISDRGTRIEYDQAYVMVPAGAAMLIRPDGSGVVIDPASKTYWTVAKMNVGMLGATLNPEVQIKPTGESATIAGIGTTRSALGIRVPLPLPTEGGFPGMPAELSISGDIWVAPQYARYGKMMPGVANGLAAIGMDMINVEGFPMRIVVRGDVFAGQEIDMVVTSIGELDAPASLFEVPADYKEVPQPVVRGVGVGR